MNIILYHFSILLDTILFGLGVLSVILVKGRLTKPIADLLNIVKIVAGASIFILIFFSIPINAIIGTGIDMALSYIAGVLLASGILRVETDII